MFLKCLKSTSNNALFPRLRRQRRAPILMYHLYTAVVRAVLPRTHETMTIVRGALNAREPGGEPAAPRCHQRAKMPPHRSLRKWAYVNEY